MLYPGRAGGNKLFSRKGHCEVASTNLLQYFYCVQCRKIIAAGKFEFSMKIMSCSPQRHKVSNSLWPLETVPYSAYFFLFHGIFHHNFASTKSISTILGFLESPGHQLYAELKLNFTGQANPALQPRNLASVPHLR